MGLRGVEPLTSRLSGSVTAVRRRPSVTVNSSCERTPRATVGLVRPVFGGKPYPDRTLAQAVLTIAAHVGRGRAA